MGFGFQRVGVHDGRAIAWWQGHLRAHTLKFQVGGRKNTLGTMSFEISKLVLNDILLLTRSRPLILPEQFY